MNYWQQSNENIYVAAHRGWRSHYPENTMEAFRAALDLGVDQLETDVRITKDGELVLIHDATVDRTTNGTGKVCEMTLAQLRELDAGNGTKIPTLKEFMELVKDHPTITLDLELKERPDTGATEEVSFSVCDRVLQMVEAYNFADRIVINTGCGRLHEYIHETYPGKYRQHVYFPQWHMGPVKEDPHNYAYCTCVFGILEGEVSYQDVENLREKTGVRIWAGAYAKDEPTIDVAVKMGAELITCDDPGTVLDILRKKNLHK